MRSLILTTILTITTGPVFAHSGAAPAPPAPRQARPVEFKLEKLTDRAYCLYGRGGNVGFLVTDAGVVVAAVEKAAKAGRSKPEAVRSISMDQYPEIKPTFRTLGNEIAVVYDELTSAR